MWRGLVAAALVVLAPGVAKAEWLRAESPRFVAYGDGSEADLRDYVARLEAFDDALRFFHGTDDTPPDRKLEVYVLENERDLRRVRPGAGANEAGFYAAGPHDIFAVVVRDFRDAEEADTVLLHEYAHHFMHQHFAGVYPAWLVEGYAEYMSTARTSGGKLRVGRSLEGRSRQLADGGWMSLEDLLSQRGSSLTPAERQKFYAQSWLLTHYMVSDPERRKQLMAYVRGLRAGEPSLAAWRGATGEDLAMLKLRLETYARGAMPILIYDRPRPGAGEVAISPMPASADDLLLERQRLRMLDPSARAKEVVDEVRTKAAAYSGDRLARLVLAQAEVLHGDRAAGEAILRQLLASNPDDVDALRLLGQSRLRAGRADKAVRKAAFGEAGSLLAKAHRLRPDDYETLVGYAQSRTLDPAFPTEHTLNVLRLAVQQAPQVDTVRMVAGRALIRAGRGDEARAVLEPVANDPHGGVYARRARDLLERLAGRAAGAAEGDKEGEGL